MREVPFDKGLTRNERHVVEVVNLEVKVEFWLPGLANFRFEKAHVSKDCQDIPSLKDSQCLSYDYMGKVGRDIASSLERNCDGI